MLFSRKRRKLKCTIRDFGYRLKTRNAFCIRLLLDDEHWVHCLASCFIEARSTDVSNPFDHIVVRVVQFGLEYLEKKHNNLYLYIYLLFIYIKLLSLFVRLFVCPIITRKSRTYIYLYIPICLKFGLGNSGDPWECQ